MVWGWIVVAFFTMIVGLAMAGKLSSLHTVSNVYITVKDHRGMQRTSNQRWPIFLGCDAL